MIKYDDKLLKELLGTCIRCDQFRGIFLFRGIIIKKKSFNLHISTEQRLLSQLVELNLLIFNRISHMIHIIKIEVLKSSPSKIFYKKK